jgi:hypothetical protein
MSRCFGLIVAVDAAYKVEMDLVIKVDWFLQNIKGDMYPFMSHPVF